MGRYETLRKSYPGYLVSKVRTNWVSNPSFETGLTGWQGGAITASQDGSVSKYGNFSMKGIVNAVAGTGYFWYAGTFGTPYIVPCKPGDALNGGGWVKFTGVGTRALRAQLMYYNNVNVQQGVSIYLPNPFTFPEGGGDWVPITFSNIIVPSNPDIVFARVMFRIEISGIPAPGTPVQIGDVLNLDGVDCRVNQPFDSYIDGSLGNGYEWTGAANASPSTRQTNPSGRFIPAMVGV
jgi:hypothetical protein